MAEPVDVGIDLGTTFSVIAHLDAQGAPVAIPNAEGDLSTPSVVHVNDDGTFVVGKPANAYPTNTARAFKRFMGEPANLFAVAGREYTAEQFSTEVLRKLVRDASAALGAPVQRAVISVPAHFGNVEREATRRAGVAAGLAVLQIINEPTAASDLYVQRQGGQAQPGYSIVFDLGGGTLDITLLKTVVNGASVEYIAERTDGSVSLGGQDFTDALTTLFIQRYKETTGQDIDDGARSLVARSAEAAKIALSNADSTTVTIAATNGPEINFPLTQQEFERVIRRPIREITSMMETLLFAANLKPEDIHRVLLVGGSSRVPRVQQMVREIFHQEPNITLDPDLSVALGAAIQARRFSRSSAKTSTDIAVRNSADIVIVDTVTQPIGVKALSRAGGYVMDVVLKEGDRYDQWSQPRVYQPGEAGQTQIIIEVYQGKLDLANNLRLGEVVVDLPLASEPKNTTIRVWMRLNQSGILEVQVSINGANPTIAHLHV